MSKQDKIKLLIAIFFFGLGIIFTSLAIQNYQVRNQAQADETDSIDINLNTQDQYGTVTQNFGILLPDIANTELVNEIDTKFKVVNIQSDSSSMFIKIVNPTVETIQNANFQKLQTSGFKWYFSFTNFTNVEAVLAEYYRTNTREVVVEINNYDNFDVTKIDPILTAYPKVKIHGAEFVFWPRQQVKDLLTKAPPPKLNAVSIKTIVDSNSSIKENLLLMFDTFWDASSDEPGSSGVEINFPANTKLALSDIQTKVGGDIKQEQARRLGIVSAALTSAIPSQEANEAPINFIIAGDVSKMSTLEKTTLLGYAHFMQQSPQVIWPQLSSNNGSVMRGVDPLIGTVAYKSSKYYALFTNITETAVTINLPDNIDFNGYLTYSDQIGAGDMLTNENKIVLKGYETVYVFPSEGSWDLLKQVVPTVQPGTATPTSPPNGATPFPTLPNIPQTAGQLVCDAGSDPYDSTIIKVTNNSDQTIDDLTSVVYRCTYEPGKIKKGFYKCETCTDGDEVNDPNCQIGTFDSNSSIVEFTLAPGESKELKLTVNACEIAQMDIYNTDDNQNDSPFECYNPRSQNTNPAPPSRWIGGIGFAIDENSTGYSNGTCVVPTTPPTNTPTPTNTPIATNTPVPTDTPAPTNTPIPSNTPLPTNTPIATLTPMPTYTPIPTFTPYPTNTPITKLEVNEQPPGMTPWAIIAVPIGLILIGLLL